MASGIAVCVGLNEVDPTHYGGWKGTLRSCEFDAGDMAMLASARGYEVTSLLTPDATLEGVSNAIVDAAARLRAGDTCLITYSGHGGQLKDLNLDEDDGSDETWCLFDGELVDDQIYDLLTHFAPGVRVLVLSDSCHSGSVIKNQLVLQAYGIANSFVLPLDVGGGGARAPAPTSPWRAFGEIPISRAMPDEVAQRTYLANKSFYDPILADERLATARERVRAPCLLISGCQDNQVSIDGAFNGAFTGMLKRVWANGKFDGSISKLVAAIKRRMPPDQTPNLFAIGPGDETEKFAAGPAFTI